MLPGCLHFCLKCKHFRRKCKHFPSICIHQGNDTFPLLLGCKHFRQKCLHFYRGCKHFLSICMHLHTSAFICQQKQRERRVFPPFLPPLPLPPYTPIPIPPYNPPLPQKKESFCAFVRFAHYGACAARLQKHPRSGFCTCQGRSLLSFPAYHNGIMRMFSLNTSVAGFPKTT